MIKRIIKDRLRAIGYDVCSFTPAFHAEARRARLIATHDIDLILDVGANTGQYGLEMRKLGWKGRTFSFEPLSSAFSSLHANVQRDHLWDAMNVALGEKDGSTVINISENSFSSSILPILAQHEKSAPASSYIGTEAVSIKRLDSIFDEVVRDATAPFLKIDTQGYSQQVLNGASDSLGRIAGIQVEVSLVPLYEGEMLMCEITSWLEERGFILMSIEPGFADAATGQLLQADCLYFRKQ